MRNMTKRSGIAAAIRLKSGWFSGLLGAPLALVWVFVAACQVEPLAGPEEAASGAGGGGAGATVSVGAGAGPVQGACGPAVVPQACETLSSAPTEQEAIEGFVSQAAVALACLDEKQPPKLVPDLAVLLQDAAPARILMVGEVHGSQEQGEFSSQLTRRLVEAQRLDAIALEIQMDVDGALAEFLKTGTGPIESQYAFSYWLKNAYHQLVLTARELHLAGQPVAVHGIDVPLHLGWVHDQLTQLAMTIADGGQRQLALEQLPERLDYDPFKPPSPSGYVEKAAAYVAHLASNRGTICSHLSVADCAHLFALADALELGARRAKGGSKGGDYYARREKLMHHNMRRILAGGSTQVLSHTGLYHAAKAGDTLAHKLELDASDEADVPYSLTVAYGPNSQLRFGNQLVDVGPSKDGVSSALLPMDRDRYFVSTRWPSQSCQQNPLLDRPIEFSGTSLNSTYGKAFDGLIWFRQLRPHP